MKVIRAGNPNYNTFLFTWMLTNWCNYSCTYCCEKGNMVDKWAKEDSISSYKLTLTKLKRFDKEFFVELYGGEPTLHPNLTEILHELKAINNCKMVQITTNLSRPLAYFDQLNLPELDGLGIMASFHPEHFDDAFITKARAIHNMQHLHFRVTVNLSPDAVHWPMTLDLIKELDANGIEYGLHFLNDTDFWKANYTEEFFKLFSPLQKNLFAGKQVQIHNYEFEDGTVEQLTDLEIYERKLHHLTGYTCTPRFYEIAFDGSVKNTCTRKSYNVPMFNATRIEETVSCPRECCGCEMMFNAYKEAP